MTFEQKKPCQRLLTGTKQKTNTMNNTKFFIKGEKKPPGTGGEIKTKTMNKHSPNKYL